MQNISDFEDIVIKITTTLGVDETAKVIGKSFLFKGKLNSNGAFAAPITKDGLKTPLVRRGKRYVNE